MYSALTQRPDYAPYNLQENQIPLNLGAPGGPTSLLRTSAGSTAGQRKDFSQQGVVPADMKPVYDAWEAWGTQQVSEHHFDGPDRVNPEQLNRYDWYSAHDWRVAYPGDSKIYLPDQVPGRNLPAAFIGDD